jgi:hypothetical protein
VPTATRTPACPVCGTEPAKRIVYGLVVGDLLDDPDVAIGGCLVEPRRPRWRCRNEFCGHEFGRR